MANSNYSIDKLNADNYASWCIQMRSLLITQDLWDVIETTVSDTASQQEKAIWKIKENKALIHLKGCKTAKEAWIKLQNIYNGKNPSRKFKRYCEPVLHMAGYSVEVIKTSHVGHAKSLMESLHQMPDVIVVAGGNGTSSEVVTGLLRRNDEMCPVLFLPLGENDNVSSIYQSILKGNIEFVHLLSRNLLSLIHGRIHYRPVIKYELIETDKQKELRKPVFGINDFSWGVLKNIEIGKDKYWYFGKFKHYVSALVTLSNDFNKNISAILVNTPPCPGCKKCQTFVKNTSWLNFSKMINSKTPLSNTNVEYKMCSTEKCHEISAKQINIKCHTNPDSLIKLDTTLINNISSRSKFLLNIIKGVKIESSTSIQSRTIKLIPVETEYKTYYIDGESYDARSVKISFLSNSLKCFY